MYLNTFDLNIFFNNFYILVSKEHAEEHFSWHILTIMTIYSLSLPL